MGMVIPTPPLRLRPSKVPIDKPYNARPMLRQHYSTYYRTLPTPTTNVSWVPELPGQSLSFRYSTRSKVFANGMFTTKTHYYQCYRTQNSRQLKILKIQNVLEFYFNKTFINSEFID